MLDLVVMDPEANKSQMTAAAGNIKLMIAVGSESAGTHRRKLWAGASIYM